MLDRLPTELVSLIINDIPAPPSIWRRKALLDSLGLVCKSWRLAVSALANEILQVDRASAVADIRKWPAARRKQVTTLLLGSEAGTPLQCDEGFSTTVMSRLLPALPCLEHVYFRNIVLESIRVDFEVGAGNPYKKLRSLSLRTSQVALRATVDSVTFALRRLHLETKDPRDGGGFRCAIERLLRSECLPHLELLRLSVRSEWLPDLAIGFFGSLRAFQVDLGDSALTALLNSHADHAVFKTDTPTLFNFERGIGEWPLAADAIVKYIQTTIDDAIGSRSAPSNRLIAIFCLADPEVDRLNYLQRHRAFRPDPCFSCGGYWCGGALTGRYRDGAPRVKIVHACPPQYEFVQPEFLNFLRDAERNNA
ncbi:hypothetical protein BMF94_3346 [Rhodotorula taiwanensis]|uniref:F-box domain-containing protein n=1 Tax=Rhodotorula taiwanensis TaxID=741276 RepID=A0A2S5BAJ9_9BASI|nr:hypothetical protein BMF94_3346 [Rhodotorula taiwanensis]